MKDEIKSGAAWFNNIKEHRLKFDQEFDNIIVQPGI